MKHILLTLSLILGATTVGAAERETWLCDGFKSTGDGSSVYGPFIMYGEFRKRYEWKHVKLGIHEKLEFVGQNWTSIFDIYIGHNVNNPDDKYAHAYYFKKYLKGSKIGTDKYTIQWFVGANKKNPHYFETDCLRQ